MSVKFVFVGTFVNNLLFGIGVGGKEPVVILPSKGDIIFWKPSFIIGGTLSKILLSFLTGSPSLSKTILPFLSNLYSNVSGS